MHTFFNEIKKNPELSAVCKLDKEFLNLPEPYYGKGKIKAILLGADPTNDGIKKNRGIKILNTVFGIDSEFEKYFFGPQLVNLKAIELNKDNLYIQNVCRNYFTEETSQNKEWKKVARIWLPMLSQELELLDAKLPVLVTAEKIMKVLVNNVPSAKDIYSMKQKPTFFSEILNRNLIPLYRHPKYYLSKNWSDYKEHLKQVINE